MEAPPAATTDNAKKDVAKALKTLEDHLKNSAFIVGDFVSLADIVLVCVLKEAFTRVFDAAFRKPYPKVTAWFENCCQLPQFAAVLGKVTMCSKAQEPQAVKSAPSKEGGKKEEKAK